MVFKKYGVKSTECIFVTDTLGDLREAKKMGINSFAVTYGFHKESVLQKGNPDCFIRKPEDILIEIKKYWEKRKNAAGGK